MFCHDCGAPNEAEAAFCEGCGIQLRNRPVPASPGAAPEPGTAMAPGSTSAKAPRAPAVGKRAVTTAIAAVVVLVAAGGAFAWWSAGPSPSSANLLAAAQKEAGTAASGDLCISNGLDYSGKDVNVNTFDSNTRGWMDALVGAGLYTDAGVVQNGAFGAMLRAYRATPELAAWGKGNRLCVARRISIEDVTNITPVKSEALGERTFKTVRAQLVWTAKETAPWLIRAAAPDRIMGALPEQDWTLSNGALQRKKTQGFALSDREWITGAAVRRLAESAERESPASQKTAAGGTGQGGSWTASLARMFSFGGHPLKGTWELDTEALARDSGLRPGAFAGMGLSQKMTFTNDALEAEGATIKATFETKGDRVTVYPQAGNFAGAGMKIHMIGADAFELDGGIMKIRFKRAS